MLRERGSPTASCGSLKLDEAEIRSFQTRNDAYHFFASTWGLIKTGGTGTNVCDLRVLLTVPMASGQPPQG